MPHSFRHSLLFTTALFGLSLGTLPAAADMQGDIQKLQQNLAAQQKLLEAQRLTLAEQKARLDMQTRELAAQRAKLEALSPLTAETMAVTSGAGAVGKKFSFENEKISAAPVSSAEDEAYTRSKHAKPATVPAQTTAKVEAETEASAPALVPVAQKIAANDRKLPEENMAVYYARGEDENTRPEVNALPDTGGVLTPRGVAMFENSLDYTNSSNNVFTFQGVQVAQVVLVGVINATSSRRQIVQDSARLRLGITNRMEADVRVPYVYRNDATTTTSGSTTTKNTIEGNSFGDIDAGVSYQINRGQEGWPFFVANLRYKHDNADGPYDVPYNSSNIAERLPTGSGFKSVEASLTTIKVTDPAVLFSNVGFVTNIGEDVNKTFGTTRITHISPGNAINASVGMGFSINPDTSFTLGYKHSHVFKTEQESIDTGTLVESTATTDSLEVGAMTFGLSYRFGPITSINMNMEVGATEDAPDIRVGVRVPVRLGKLFD